MLIKKIIVFISILQLLVLFKKIYSIIKIFNQSSKKKIIMEKNDEKSLFDTEKTNGFESIKFLKSLKEDCFNIVKNKQKSEVIGISVLVKDPIMMTLLIKEAKKDINFRENLMEIILISRDSNEEKMYMAAANAISILVASNYSFSGKNLNKIKIPGAIIRDGVFSNCNFSEADLTDVVMENCKIDGAIFHKTIMKNTKVRSHIDFKNENKVKSLTINKLGTEIACGCENGSIKILEIANVFKILKVINVTHTSIETVEFSPDLNGKLILCGFRGKNIKLWNKSTGNLLRSFRIYSSAFANFRSNYSHFLSIALFSPNGSYILGCFTEYRVSLWKTSTGALLKKFGENDNTSIAISPKGSLILCGKFNGTINLFDIYDFKSYKSFINHTKPITALFFSKDGSLILSASRDNTINLWMTETGLLIKKIQENLGTIAFSPDEKSILISSGYNMILLEINTEYVLRKYEGHTSDVNSILFSPDGLYVFSASNDKTIKKWATFTQPFIKLFYEYSSHVNSCIFSSDGKFILNCSSDKTIKLWDCISGRLLQTFNGHSKSVNCIAFSPNAKFVISGSSDKTIKLWDTSNGTLIKTLECHSAPLRSLSFSKSGRFIIGGSIDKTISLWEFSNNYSSIKPIKVLKGHTNCITSVAFSANELYILSGSIDSKIKLWERSGRVIKTWSHHSDSVSTVAFCPDGQLIMSGSWDKTVRIFKLSNGKLIKIIRSHNSPISAIAFSKDGHYILSGSENGVINMYFKLNGNLISTFTTHENILSSLVFSIDDKFILISFYDAIYLVENPIKNLDMKSEESLDKSQNFYIKYILSNDYTPFTCKDALFTENIGISIENKDYLLSSGAIFK